MPCLLPCDCVGDVENEDGRTLTAPATTASENESWSSDQEVDVVSVVPVSRRPCLELNSATVTTSTTASRPASVVRDLLVLPPACSLLARVTDIHNYTRHNCSTPTTTARRGLVYSAPQVWIISRLVHHSN